MPRDYFYPKKGLGQTFLKSRKIAQRLVSSLNLKEGEKVLEVGPGKGVLTEFLLAYPVTVVGVEIDKRLASFLEEKFKEKENFAVICADILKYDLPGKNWKIIGNIPYSISSPFLFYLFNNWQKWQMAVLTLQKELAQRLLAKPKQKDYGALSTISSLYVEKEKLFPIPARFFKPKPKVDSLALILHRKEKVLDDPNFVSFLKTAFSHRRKTLLNNLSAEADFDKDRLKELFERKGISPNLRAEELGLKEFHSLYYELKKV